MSFASAAARSANNEGRTFNGAGTNITTHSACLDFFAQAPAMRGKEAQALILFQKAYAENREIALRTLLWLRDVRGGSGERATFRYLLGWLSQTNVNDAALIIMKTPEVGRWDDLFSVGGEARKFALSLASSALILGDRLAAKWMPREGSARERDAIDMMAHLGLKPREYRKLLSGASDTVEQKMCARQWDDINFSHVPSIAAKNYQKAFGKRAAEAYAAYKAALVKNDGTAKVNASAIFPHDVLVGLKRGDEVVAEAQWRSLPNYITEDANILSLIDISGSMSSPVGGEYGNGKPSSVSCRDVAIGLGLYTAERLPGAFNNTVMTFSASARAVVMPKSASLKSKLQMIDDGYWGNTNLKGAFEEILRIAQRGKVAPSDMPSHLLILSDMEFDAATNVGALWTRTARTRNPNSMDMVRKAYADAGYAPPKIIFWNLTARLGNNPVTIKDDGTALVGGYSPALLKALLGCKDFSPENVMLEAVMVDRYALPNA